MTSFSELGLSEKIVASVTQLGYATPTPIQAKAIPLLLEGRDLIGLAQTGTGKTAAFGLPIIEMLMKQADRPANRTCRTLILAPTRELVNQIGENLRAFVKKTPLRINQVVGGASINKQQLQLEKGTDILVATPGRLLDLIARNAISLSKVTYLVLDEADQMLDLGFIHSIRRVVPMLPHRRQTLFFSATMPKAIKDLADTMLTNPAMVAVTPVAKTADRVEQSIVFVEQAGKRVVLAEILKDPAMERALVFTRTKHGADKVVRQLEQDGVEAAAIHGNKSQPQRERALGAFRTGHIKVLIATDIAARGIDVDGVSHVVNYDVPNVPESYVHRIGRTARAGAAGIAVSLVANDERAYLRDIERLIKQQIPTTDRRSEDGKAEAEGTGAASKLGQSRGQRQGAPRGDRGHNERGHGGGRPQRQGEQQPQGERRTHGHHAGRPEGHGGENRGRGRPNQQGGDRAAQAPRGDGDLKTASFMQKPRRGGRPGGNRPRSQGQRREG